MAIDLEYRTVGDIEVFAGSATGTVASADDLPSLPEAPDGWQLVNWARADDGVTITAQYVPVQAEE